MNYLWYGIDHTGQLCQGKVDVININIAKQKLQQQNIILLKLTAQKNNIFSKLLLLFAKKKIKTSTLADFMQQLAFLINANIPLVTSFAAINKDNINKHLHQLIEQIKNDIETGHTLTHALQQHPQYFSKFWCNLINTGEQSGTLPTILNHISQHITKSTKQKHKIIKALLYPCAVLTIAVIVTIIMLIFVIPRFQEMFSNFGAALPLYTQFIIKIANLVKNYGIYFLLFCLINIFGVFIAKKHSSHFSQQLEKISLHLPLFGNILHKHLCIQYAQTLYITIKAGIPLCEALNITANNIHNRIYQQSVHKICQAITYGSSLNEAMRQQQLFSERILQLVALGEESGNLENMFCSIANYYEEEVNYIIDNLNNMLEPLLMLVLGVIVGGLIIGMYLPIFRMGNIV